MLQGTQNKAPKHLSTRRALRCAAFLDDRLSIVRCTPDSLETLQMMHDERVPPPCHPSVLQQQRCSYVLVRTVRSTGDAACFGTPLALDRMPTHRAPAKSQQRDSHGQIKRSARRRAPRGPAHTLSPTDLNFKHYKECSGCNLDTRIDRPPAHAEAEARSPSLCSQCHSCPDLSDIQAPLTRDSRRSSRANTSCLSNGMTRLLCTGGAAAPS